MNVYTKENERYDAKITTGEKPIKYHIALVDADLNITAEYHGLKKLFLDYTVSAACQVTVLNSVKGGYVVNFRLIDLDGTLGNCETSSKS